MKKITYKTALRYLFAALIFATLNFAVKGVPFSIAALFGFLNLGMFPPALCVLFCGAAFINFSPSEGAAMLVTAAFAMLVYFIYGKKKKRVGFEQIFYISVALCPYIFGSFLGDIYQKLIYSSIIAILSLIFTISARVIFIKKFTKKADVGELASFYLSLIAVSLGLIEIAGAEIWYDVALIATLFLCSFYKSSRAFIPAFVLPLGIAIYYSSLTPLALFEIYCACALLFIGSSKLFSALALVLAQFTYLYLSGLLPSFTAIDYCYAFIPAIVFLFTPEKVVSAVRERLLKFDEPEITREIINEERARLSSELYGISEVFSDLENNVSSLGKLALTKENLTDKIVDEIMLTVCENCRMRARCLSLNKPERDDLYKLTSIGIVKGKISLIDLSKDFSTYCYSTNSMLCEINRLIGVYADHIEQTKAVEKGRDLIALQSAGLADVLRNLAYGFSVKCFFKRKSETRIFNALCAEGFVPRQIVVMGENEEFHLLFSRECNDYKAIGEVISSVAATPLCLTKKLDLGDGMLAVYKKAPLFDACFGVAQRSKSGANVSGDTHSMTKIDEGHFLVGLCDGMGSGEKANENSTTAISLIENFYRAKVKPDTVLTMTNKLLSLCAEDSFSALDIAIIDLYGGKCDVIKIGATFGFLISHDGIRLIENSSLPLGILEEVAPSSVSLKISSGDMLVLLSDGITDAFFSSTDMLDFLDAERCLNPQSLADKILAKAIELDEDNAKDDMTALVIKVFEKTA